MLCPSGIPPVFCQVPIIIFPGPTDGLHLAQRMDWPNGWIAFGEIFRPRVFLRLEDGQTTQEKTSAKGLCARQASLKKMGGLEGGRAQRRAQRIADRQSIGVHERPPLLLPY